jgi:beta-glucanase (GH16 family)
LARLKVIMENSFVKTACQTKDLFSSRIKLRFAAVCLVFLACTTFAAAQNWGNPVWSDEFNGPANSAISSTNWQYDTGILNVNDEAEYYCAPGSNTAPCVASNPNAYIDGNGHLVIQAIEINSSVAPYSGSWTSARLKTETLQNFQYGRLESSMTLPLGAGLWPAYWALGNNLNSVGWPASGEIDFMENVPLNPGGLGPTKIQSTIHGGNSSASCYCGANGLGMPYTFPSNDANGTDVATFHSYGAIWSYNMVQFYVDSPANIFFVRTASDIPSGFTWDFNHPFFLLLNLAVGGTGSWPGPPSSSTPNPALMVVDYVRYYQASAVAGPSMNGSAISARAGGIGSSTISLSLPSGSGRVYLSCTTTAPSATCAVNSGDPLDQYTVDFSNSVSGTATVNVTTAANPAGLIKPTGFDRRPLRGGLSTLSLGGFVFALLISMPAKWNRSLRRTLEGTGLTLILLLATGCGGGSSGSGGMASGNYTVTVNAYTVSNTSGNPDSTVTLNLMLD